ncbi:MAG: thioredoxin family protein [Nitrosotalea sp.]
MEHVTPEEFDSKVLNNDQKTLVLFYASWCPYCATSSQHLRQLIQIMQKRWPH